MKWVRPRLVTIVGYNKENKQIVKEVVLPYQYHETLDKVKAVEGIAKITVSENYKTW